MLGFSGSVVVDFLFIVTPIVGVCNCSMFCCTLLDVHTSIAIILMGNGELVALLNLSSWCLVTVEWLFLPVPWGCLRFVIVVFPDHTPPLFQIRQHYLQLSCHNSVADLSVPVLCLLLYFNTLSVYPINYERDNVELDKLIY